jgi:short-subunit dehydrogenase involved in D-alanine esterification of teichoic acids
MKLEGAHVLLTGGTDGIGLALAQALVGAGARVTLCGRRDERLAHARARLGQSALAVRCDVGDFSSHGDLLLKARAAHGPIDLLINNAGVQQLMDFTREGEERHIASEVAVNLTAPLLLTEAVLPELRSRPEAAIVQVTSGLALSPKPGAPVYCATKAGLRAFTRALRWQLEGTSVRVLEVLPPLVDTAMTHGRGRGKVSPDFVAQAVVRALRGRQSEVLVGRSRLLWVLTMLAPWLAARITRRM